MRRALLGEFRRVLSPPYEAPLVVLGNGLLMTGAWLFLPPAWLFSLHEPRVFSLTLAVWMYADVPATNVLGSDAGAMAALLDRPADLKRALRVRNLVLWSLVTPICLVVALAIGIATHETAAALLSTVAFLLVLPWGMLGAAGWLGIVFPYHPLPLAVRWQHRRPLSRMVLRWLALVLVPYVWVPALGWLVLAPSLLAWRLSGTSWTDASDLAALLGAVLTTVVAALAWWGGLRVAARLVVRREEALRRSLADPLTG